MGILLQRVTIGPEKFLFGIKVDNLGSNNRLKVTTIALKSLQLIEENHFCVFLQLMTNEKLKYVYSHLVIGKSQRKISLLAPPRNCAMVCLLLQKSFQNARTLGTLCILQFKQFLWNIFLTGNNISMDELCIPGSF